MQFEIPDHATDYLRQRAAAAGFDDVEQFVLRRALFDDQELAAMDEAAQDPRATDLIVDGLRSGPMTAWTKTDFDALRQKVMERIGDQNGSSA
jgi:hypothetical protein